MARIIFLLTFLVGVSLIQALAQGDLTSSSEIINHLDQKIGVENSGLINGRQYTMVVLGGGTNPFFAEGETTGFVRYHNQTFQTPLLYDIFKDEIIVKHLSSAGVAWFVQLDKSAVDYFKISSYHFQNFPRGFHEVIYEGDDFLILAKRSKAELLERGIRRYINTDRYFVFHDNTWQPLVNSSGFADLLETKEEKKEFKTFVRTNRIKIRRFVQDDLVKMGTYLDTLRKRR